MKFTIKKEHHGKRIDAVLAERSPTHSRAWWQTQIKEARVLVGDQKVGNDYRVSTGDVISIQDPPPLPARESNLLFTAINIVDLTDDFIVIEKPSGLLTHPVDAHDKTSTLAEWVTTQYPEIKNVGDDALRPGIIHRLDKEVSGLMLIARTQFAFDYFKQQFTDRLIKKEYTALAHGVLEKSHDTINFRVTRSKRTGAMASLPVSSSEGKEAATEYDVRQKFTHATLVSVFPLTGRTHQIRVHFFAINHPLVGDPLYKSSTNSDALDSHVSRIFLHSTQLTFTDPYGETHTYSSPLPNELQQCLNNLTKL